MTIGLFLVRAVQGVDFSSPFADLRDFCWVYLYGSHEIHIVSHDYSSGIGYLTFDGTYRIQNDMIFARVKIDCSDSNIGNLYEGMSFDKRLTLNGLNRLMSDYLELRFVMVKCFMAECKDVIEYLGKGKKYKYGLYFSDHLSLFIHDRISASSGGFTNEPIRRGVYILKNPIYP